MKPEGSLSRSEMRKRRKRRKRIIITLVTIFVLLVVGVGAGAYFYNQLQSKVTTVDTKPYVVQKDRPKKAPVPNPTDHFSGPLNIMLIGSDERDKKDNSTVEGMRSDTVMIAHISADRKRVELVSIPRDSWVKVPSCTLPDGTETAPFEGKFNSAFSVGGQTGDVGAAVACTQKTIESLTGIFLDDYVVIDFNGFKDMVDALGGVEIDVKQEINDPEYAKVHLQPGKQMMDGKTALKYARVRKGVGMDGSDTSRIKRQQDLLNAIIKKAQSKTTDPGALYKLAEAGLGMVTTSDQLGNLGNMTGLAWALKGVTSQNLTFITVPFVDRGDGANIIWSAQAQDIWTRLINDHPISGTSYKNGKPTEHTAPALATPMPSTTDDPDSKDSIPRKLSTSPTETAQRPSGNILSKKEGAGTNPTPSSVSP